MKACPHCGREVRDEAIKCRHCDGDLRSTAQMAPPPGAGPGPGGEEAVRFSHSGHRFVLGFGSDFFGIWDRQTPGGPVERFPRTDPGWVAAWRRFEAIEPNSLPVGTSARPARAGPAQDGGAHPPAEGLRELLASPWQRLGARLIDGLILFVAAFFVALGLSGSDDPQTLGRVTFFVLLALSFAYEVPLVATRGQTVGKMAVQIEVVRQEDGEGPGWGRAAIRWVVPTAATIVPLGALIVYLWLLWDRNRQGLHDKAARTLVVEA